MLSPKDQNKANMSIFMIYIQDCHEGSSKSKKASNNNSNN